MERAAFGPSAIIDIVRQYYTATVTEYGPTHLGVDWDSSASQELRFKQLLRACGATGGFSLNDYGCGYGALAEYLHANVRAFSYHGYDATQAMVEAARGLFARDEYCDFTDDTFALAKADYTVASGVFSVKFDVTVERWKAYVLQSIDVLAAMSTRAFAFNLMRVPADPETRRDYLYYTDPQPFVEYCAQRFAGRVVLLEDYPLEEFTIGVRLPPVSGT